VVELDEFIGGKKRGLEVLTWFGALQWVAGSDWLERGYVQRDVLSYFFID
jgi:hypothetical protein